jgi:biotin carboxyl carrier protein
MITSKVEIKAPVPGLVARVLVKPGDKVDNGTNVVVLNVMKTEVFVASDATGIVEEIKVKEWDEVDIGTPLIILKKEM